MCFVWAAAQWSLPRLRACIIYLFTGKNITFLKERRWYFLALLPDSYRIFLEVK
jgi:hypothetical protein